MEEIYGKITEITNIWNDFILEQEYFRKKLKLNKETETNYYSYDSCSVDRIISLKVKFDINYNVGR